MYVFALYLVSKLCRTHINFFHGYKISYLSKSSRILDSTTRYYDSILSKENRPDSESWLWLPCLCKQIKAGEGSVRMSFHTWRSHVPSRNREPSWEKLRFARSLYRSLSQFGQKNYFNMLVPCHDTMPISMIFRCALDLHELKKPSFSIFLAESRGPDVRISLSSLAWDL